MTVRIGDTVTSLARVARDPENGLVELALVPAAGPAVPAGTPIDIGWSTHEGTRWHAAVVTDGAAGDSAAFVARIQSDVVHVEQRRFPRARVEIAATIVQHEDQRWSGTVIDVGLGGLRVVGEWQPAAGELALITLEIAEGDRITFAGRVRRVDGDAVVVRYELFGAGARERLIETAFREAATVAA